MFLALSLLLIFTAALCTPVIAKFLEDSKRWLFALVPLSVFALLLNQGSLIASGENYSEQYHWLPSFGIDIALKLDGLSYMMALLISGIGSLILVYACGYLKGYKANTRFYVLIQIFMGAMLGLVLSDNLLVLFIFWELTTVSSFLLVGFNHEDIKVRKKALQALLITGGGGLAMLAGVLLLGSVGGSFQLSQLADKAELIKADPLYIPICILLLVGAFTKSAQFPFHFWLPNAMAAPTPVSAYLHSATMVKAGVYLLARLTPILGGTEFWLYTLVSVGGVTMLLAACLGLIYRDLKKILAYSTISILGVITLLIGMGTELSFKAAVLMIFAHALYKATLFMVAGSVDHACGTRDTTKLRGLRKYMPWTFFAAALAALSQAGFPPFKGFLAKEYLYNSALNHNMILFMILTTFTSNILLFVLAFKIGFLPFLGKLNPKHNLHPHEAPFTMLLGPVSLASLGLIFGLIPGFISTYILSPALSTFSGQFHPVKLSLWHGFNTTLLLSILTLACGLILFNIHKRIRSKSIKADQKLNIHFDRKFALLLEKFIKFAKWQTKLVQSGSLRSYMFITVGTFTALLIAMLLYLGGLPDKYQFSHVRFTGVAFVFIIALTTVAVCLSRSRMTALLSLGVIGFGITLIYMFYGAPDLAITQILVETLSVVMFMMVLHKLPKMTHTSSISKRTIDAIFSGICGLTITFLVIKAQNLKLAPSVSDQYAELSYLAAKGRNVVNVILVDFRAFDTFGEITVLCIAALGIRILVKRNKTEQG